MNKTLRIFAKDTRHLWPEILLSLALTAGFALTQHFAWPQFRNNLRESDGLINWIVALMPISWWFLIARAVHDESLVGDRQFWITRPYGWTRVLFAKLLFIAAYILVPLFLAQCFLLHQAGLHPMLVIPGLLYSVVLFIFFFLVPVLALSTITANITRMFVIIFGLVVYSGITAYIASLISTLLSISTPWVPEVTHPVAYVLLAIPAITLVVTFVQYSGRRTRLSIALLLGLVVILTVGALAATFMPGNVARDFPTLASTEQPPVIVSFNPDPALQHDPATNPNVASALKGEGGERSAQVPITLSGIAPDHAVTFEAQTFTISAPGKPTETIGWERGAYAPFVSRRRFSGFGSTGPATGDSNESLNISAALIREFANLPATIHLTYAVNELEAETPTTVMFDGHSADVPENGHCLPLKSDLNLNVNDTGLSCQYSLTGPSFTHVAWQLHDTCGAGSKTLDQQTWIGDTERGVRAYDISPVALLPTFLANNNVVEHPPATFRLCPNAPLTFTRYHVIRRRLMQVTLPPIDLRLYVLLPDTLHAPVPFAPEDE